MGNTLIIDPSIIGQSKVYEFEVVLNSGKYQVIVCSDGGKSEVADACDKAKYAQDVGSYVNIMRDGIEGKSIVIVADNRLVWFAVKSAGLWLVRDGYVKQVANNLDWGSGFWEEGDSLIGVWGNVEDLEILEKESQVLTLILARMQNGDVNGLLIKAKEVEVKDELLQEHLESDTTNKDLVFLGADEMVLSNNIAVVNPDKSHRLPPRWINWLPDQNKVTELESKFHLENYRPKGKGLLQIIGGGLLVLWILLGTIGWWRVQGQQLKGDWDKQVLLLNQKVEEAISVGSSNNIRAEGLLEDADAILGQLSNSGVGKEQLDSLRNKIKDVRSRMTGVYDVTPTTWFTLELAREGLKADDVDLGNGKLWILDKIGQRVVSIDTNTKSPEVVWGQDNVGQASNLAVTDINNWWVDGQRVVAASSKAIATGSWDTSWGQVVDSGNFGENYYVLTTSGIIRCELKDSIGCSQWLKQESLEKWIGYRSMAIDGKIWVATETTLMKFVSGSEEKVNINGLEAPWIEIYRIYTSDLNKNLYILDRGAKRLVIVDKESSTVVKVLDWDKMDTIVDLAVDESVGKIWLVSNEVIYETGVN